MDYKVHIPEGVSGDWGVETYTAPYDPYMSERLAQVGRNYVPGSYTRLYYKRPTNVVMSDTPDEYADHTEAIERASGRVLINGLGIGMVLKAMLAKPSVTHIDVVEIEADVLSLVAPYYSDPRITYHHASAYTIKWPEGFQWDLAWHDIWPTMDSQNLEDMAHLMRKYEDRVQWQGCWGMEYCLHLLIGGL